MPSRAATFGGITTAASTLPDSICLTACEREPTCTGCTCEKISSAYALTGTRWLPTCTVCPGGVSSTTATFGLPGEREIARPISSAIAIG